MAMVQVRRTNPDRLNACPTKSVKRAGGIGRFAWPLLLELVAALPSGAFATEYRSTAVDQSGQLHIIPDNGKEILPAKMRGQMSFEDPAISPDRSTIGWLVMYPDPTVTYYKGAQFSGRLVVYRAGRVLHTFTTEQTFYGWEFQDNGKRVAYCTGPAHGGASECVLRAVDSGRAVARWWVKEGSEPPTWAKSLRY